MSVFVVLGVLVPFVIIIIGVLRAMPADDVPLMASMAAIAASKEQVLPAFGVREFTNTIDYNDWLTRWGSDITILSVNTTKRWSLWTGFFGTAKTITVTFQNTSTK